MCVSMYNKTHWVSFPTVTYFLSMCLSFLIHQHIYLCNAQLYYLKLAK